MLNLVVDLPGHTERIADSAAAGLILSTVFIFPTISAWSGIQNQTGLYCQLQQPAQDTHSAVFRTEVNMAQGEIKKKAAPASTKAKPMKGQKVKKPKSTKADKLQKKYTSGMVSKTEALLGERAGHLELIGKGKKAKKDEKHKGGSRKFG